MARRWSAGVLSQRALERSRQSSFRPAAAVQGLHHGFFEMPIGTRSVLGHANLSHGGNSGQFVSRLMLLPQFAFGLFVTTNSGGGGALTSTLSEAIVGRYFPAVAGARQPVSPRASFAEYAGNYRITRRLYTKLAALQSLSFVIKVEDAHNDQLIVTLASEDPQRYTAYGHDSFRQVRGDARIAFQRDAGGSIIRVVGPRFTGERVGLFDSKAWLDWVLAGSFAAALLSLIAAWRSRARDNVDTLVQRWAGRLALAHGASWLVFLGLATIWSIDGGLEKDLTPAVQPFLGVVLCVLLISVGLTGLSWLGFVSVWRSAAWSRKRKWLHMLALIWLSIAALTLHQWNAVGFNY